MTRLTLEQLLLVNLAENMPGPMAWGYMPKEDAYTMLKQLTGQDFGYDMTAWKAWLRKNKVDFRNLRLK
jgi:hypothetical protein